MLGIVNILAGVVLLSGLFEVVPVFGKHLDNFAKWLGGFQIIIGVISLIMGFLYFGGLQSWIAITAGFVLSMGAMHLIPGIGKKMESLAKLLGGFQVIIGVIAIIVGFGIV